MEAAVETFLASLDKEAYSDSTRQAYRSDLKIFTRYLKEKLHKTPDLDDLSPQQVASFLESEKKSGLRNNTLLRRRASLQCFEKYLRKQGLIKPNYLLQDSHLLDKAINVDLEKNQVMHLSDEQIGRLKDVLVKSSKPLVCRDQAILAVLLEMALSVSTLISLKLTDLDLENCLLRLANNDSKDYWMPLRDAGSFVERYVRESRPELNPSPEENALFISQVGVQICRQSVWQILRHWGKVAQIPVKLSPRLLRHTAVYTMIKTGRPLAELQVLLGHRNPLSTYALIRRMGAETAEPGMNLDLE